LFNHANNEWVELPGGESDADEFWKNISNAQLIEYTEGAVEQLDKGEDDVLTRIQLPRLRRDAMRNMILVAGSDAPPGSRLIAPWRQLAK